MIRALTLASVLALLPAAAAADHHQPGEAMTTEQPDIGLAVGSQAPDTALTRTDGAQASLTSLAGTKGVVVAFVRSAEWCPYCMKQMKELEEAAAPLADAGWTLVAVSYDAPEVLADFRESNDLSYDLLSDPDSEAIRAFNLLNAEMEEGTRYYGIPHPAIVFVGADNTVRALLREEGYKTRPPVDLMLETAAGL